LAYRRKAAQYGAATVDFYNTDIFTNPATLYSNGNYPNPAGYEKIAQIWFAVLEPYLK
jgi:lysophospholipase L1-like esterase